MDNAQRTFEERCRRVDAVVDLVLIPCNFGFAAKVRLRPPGRADRRRELDVLRVSPREDAGNALLGIPVISMQITTVARSRRDKGWRTAPNI
ncbi:hypothetical protein [Paraburkholderia ferrariae]|uniref:hypothetical protein n=1 Tax=Paraburkholderia ferrariae TaxID=386056 RepID=UPI00157B92A2|nr:hypothetical protein [Paraburkholderia ferrariae]